MSWFFYALLTMFLWGGADLFYKKGADCADRYSHLKTSVCVGTVMGIHAVLTILFGNIDYNFINLIKYLPVSLCYIISMTVGYFGLRYLELSVSSPVQNTSGAIVCILCVLLLGQKLSPVLWCAIALICIAVFLLGLFERRETNIKENDGKKYILGFTAVSIPVLYCIIDALGTFFDAYYLDDISTTPLVGATEESLETVANISYELTFFAVAIFLFIYLCLIKKQKYEMKYLRPSRLLAAVLETAGQFTYVYAMSGKAVVAAPMVAAYSVVSLFSSRIFLKEKLNIKKYICIVLVLLGIVILGIYDV
ncbi:MAG: EamA family transporter [Clostridiales bacterium]|nr:EamA family transporter [Candidatus Equinaster intestinalis]